MILRALRAWLYLFSVFASSANFTSGQVKEDTTKQPVLPAPAKPLVPKPADSIGAVVDHRPKLYEEMDYGPTLSATIIAPAPSGNVTNKAIAIRVGSHAEGTVIFDSDLMRWSAGWTGGFLNFTNVAFNGEHGSNLTVKGALTFCASPTPGWTPGTGPDFNDPRDRPFGPITSTQAKYRGLYLSGEHTVVSYTVGDTPVLETPGITGLEGGSVVFTRTIQVGHLPEGRCMLVADLAEAVAPILEKNPTLAVITTPPILESKTVVGLIGAPPRAKLDVLGGDRIYLRVPPIATEATFTVAIWKGRPEDQPKFERWLAEQVPPSAGQLKAYLSGGPARWTKAITTTGVRGTSTTPDGAYTVDTLTAPEPNPYHSWMRFGGFDFFKDGHRAAISTWSGDVWIVEGIDESLDHLTWKRFATGLFQPLGLRIVDDEIYVLGRDQLTRLHDLNHDGEADFYECFNNDLIATSSFHEFTFDLQTDRQGNFYFARAGAVRSGGRGWERISPHNGTLMRVSKDGKKLEVFATGLRAPNGLGMGPHDELTIADNEGTWTPSSRLSLVKAGDFLGNADLSHRDQVPTNYGNPIFWLPHGEVDNSSGGQAWVTDNRWGPFNGHILHLSYGKSSLFLVMNEEVEGLHQGGAVKFPLTFETGIMRARFNAEDGQLYLCGLKGWQTNAAKDGAFQRVRYTGKPVAMPSALRIRPHGVEIDFTTPLDKKSAEDPQNFSVEQWNYKWTSAYGSPEFSVSEPNKKGHDDVEVRAAHLSADGKTLSLEFLQIAPVMQMKIKFTVNSAAGAPLDFELYNTISVVPKK